MAKLGTPSIVRTDPPTILWGNLPEVKDIRTPKMVLLVQANALQKITQGGLACEVATSANGNGITNVMRIVAPSLGNYSVSLVVVMHELIVYPCNIQSPFLKNVQKQCANEDELETALKEILQAKKTHKLIIDLLAQIRAENRVVA